MTTVLRVKRRSSELPSDSLMLSFLAKRRKLDSPDDSDVCVLPAETIAQFAGTLKDPTEDVMQHLATFLSDVNTENVKGIKRPIDNDNVANTSRKICKCANSESTRGRYKVISCHPLSTVSEEKFENKCTTLVEIEDCWSHAFDQNSEKDTEKEQEIEQYVYDLYYAQADVGLEQNDIWVQEYMYECDYESNESRYDSENENSESNPRNDYPDTDPDCSGKGYNSESSFDAVSDDDLYGESATDRRYFSSSYNDYRHIVQNYNTDSSSEEENDGDESFGNLLSSEEEDDGN
ncbi:hypothetical protein DMN91_001355 [Ooceraea biroi]|uniref:RNA polymerase II nuclear localization protein SLC7A6OS n=1 Tax=Ooceraea biroi TaxID=2015173 RepID=A0A026W003_OOCBI|nr:probable RNA polymerase II nuclear localization protein SLC7A6OS [Ooceraea biroi]EZA49225.1 hypothetical protein X777_12521 [Ooceraea biroi]RLU27551.1 hypothetical protein DMN91_001355 [Ooceraea biroi]